MCNGFGCNKYNTVQAYRCLVCSGYWIQSWCRVQRFFWMQYIYAGCNVGAGWNAGFECKLYGCNVDFGSNFIVGCTVELRAVFVLGAT